MILQAQDIFKSVAALLNDQGFLNNGTPTLFTYTVQTNYLNIALAELRESLEQYNIQRVNKTVTNLVLLAGATEIDQADLPNDLVAPQHLWERTNGQSEDWLDMQRVEFLPPYEVMTTCLVYWAYYEQNLNFIGATSDRNLRLDYIADALPKIIDPTDDINMIDAQSFLHFRTAALCSEFVGENQTRAQALNNNATIAMDRLLQIMVKDKQAIATRRRPFQQSYRSGGWITS